MNSYLDSEIGNIDDVLAQSVKLTVPACPHNVDFIGIRHHSPRCATVVKQWINEQRPDVVLIEAPSDIKPMLSQLLLPHSLPIALFSYRQERRFERLNSDGLGGNDGTLSVTPDVDYHGDVQTAQSWFPLLSFSPEWVAIQSANALGAAIDFIDLPHWSYRARHSNQRAQAELNAADAPGNKDRYTQVMTQLLRITGCDNQDALWERWFESAPTDIVAERLRHYFNLLRASEVGSDEDQCREGYMASWVNHHRINNPTAKILVICGGWHVNGIKRLLAETYKQADHSIPNLDTYLTQYFNTQQPNTDDNQSDTQTSHIVAQGNYLIPIDFTRVERLTGYAAGMPSPQYYQWLFDADMQANVAFEQAMVAITQAVRAAKQPLSTSDLIVWSQASHNLAQLRGLDNPYRQELLDGMLNSIINEALSLPPPWSSSRLADPDFNNELNIELNHSDGASGYDADVQIRPLYTQDHPLLKLALATLTGSQRGVLAQDNPPPPLLKYVEYYLARLDITLNIMPTAVPRSLTLSYRRNSERLCLYALWQLKVLGISSVSLLASKASLTSFKSQPSKLATASERWQLHQNSQWEVQLIEASRFGTTLHEASKAALMEQLTHAKYLADTGAKIAVISRVLTQMIQCGFSETVPVLTTKLSQLLWYIQDRSAVSQLGKNLASLMQRGFYGHDIEALLAAPFITVIERLLWLLEGTDTPKSANKQAAKQADIISIEVLVFAIENADSINIAAVRANETNEKITYKASNLKTLNIVTMMTVLYRLTQAPQYSQNQQQAHLSQTLRGACIAAYFSLSNRARLRDYFIVQTTIKTPYLFSYSTVPERKDSKKPSPNNDYKTVIQKPWRLIPEQLPTLNYIILIKAIPLIVLGDFLLGLFAIGRHDIMYNQQTELLRCLHSVISTSNDEAFLQSLPSLRQAFIWFPPQERYQISKNLAIIMGLDAQQTVDWQVLLRQRLPDTAVKVADQMTKAALLEQQTAICLHNLTIDCQHHI